MNASEPCESQPPSGARDVASAPNASGSNYSVLCFKTCDQPAGARAPHAPGQVQHQQPPRLLCRTLSSYSHLSEVEIQSPLQTVCFRTLPIFCEQPAATPSVRLSVESGPYDLGFQPTRPQMERNERDMLRVATLVSTCFILHMLVIQHKNNFGIF